jgi:hypothetical protein
VPRYLHALHVLTTSYYAGVVRTCLTADDAAEAEADDAYPNLLTELRRAHQAGWQPERALAQAVRDARTDTDDDQTTRQDGGTGARSMTRRTADNLRDLARSLDPPAPLHQPTAEDLDRYRNLLAERGITVGGTDLQTALERPALLAAPAFDPDPRPHQGHHWEGARGRLPELTARTYTQAVARALGARAASQITRRGDWPALQAALRRADIAGHDPQALLSRPSIRNGADRATSPCLFLDRRISDYLTDHPTPALTWIDAATSTGRAHAWTHLAWAMKAAEDHGADPATLLPAAATGRDQDTSPGPACLAQAWLHAQAVARQARPSRPHPVLAGGTPPRPGTVARHGAAYLADTQHAIAGRVAGLRAALDQALTDNHLPEWTGALGPAPRRGADRERWLDQAATVAAFRDQYPPAVDDPAQPLGPHPEPAPHADPAHRAAHAHAALALACGYDLAHPTARAQTPGDDGEPLTDRQAETLRQVTSDAYKALPHHQKIAVAATLLARLGTLPTAPGPTSPDPTQEIPEAGTDTQVRESREAQILSGLDEGVTTPAAARHLLRALAVHGLTAPRDVLPEPPTATDPTKPRQTRPSRLNPPATRPRPLPRPERRPRPQIQAPAEPRTTPTHDYSPKPGARPQPGPDQPRPRW